MQNTINGIDVVGLSSLKELTCKALEADNLFLQRSAYPMAEYLKEIGICFQTFDHIYESKDTITDVYAAIADTLVQEASSGKKVIYALPGTLFIGDGSIPVLLERAKDAGIPVRFLGNPELYQELTAIQGLTILDGASICPSHLNPALGTVITNIDHHVRSILLNVYPHEHKVLLMEDEGVWLPLCEIRTADGTSWLFVPPLNSSNKALCNWPLDPIVKVMETLRSDKGCPWDREQTPASLRPYVIEEAYEVVDAIDKGSPDMIQEELGDLLLQVVFHAQIGREEGTFDMNSIIDGIVEKMIRRHPHVFGNADIKTAEGVLVTWEKIKEEERRDGPRSILDGIPGNLPALTRAYKVQKKAAKVGFDWDNINGAMEKVFEELDEVKEEVAKFSEKIASEDMENIEEELGDLLFALVNVARFLKIEPEVALTGTINKFYRRFHRIEEEARRLGLILEEMTLEEMDKIWEAAKE
jgi:tetrapyrrole methylase family protein/MazG family protein